MLRLLCSWMPVPLACVWFCFFKMGSASVMVLLSTRPAEGSSTRGSERGLYQDSSSTAALLMAGFGFLLGELEETQYDSRCQAEPAGWAEEM